MVVAVLGAGGLGPPARREQHPLRVVGLGDSVTAGAACFCKDFVRAYAERVGREQGVAATASNLGVNGLTADGLATLLDDDEQFRATVRAGDVVLVTIGANDLSAAYARWRAGSCRPTCPAPELTGLGVSLDAVLDRVNVLRSGRPTLVLVTGYWNLFPDGSVGAGLGAGYLRWSGDLTERANARIREASVRAGDRYVDLREPFEGTDGDRDPTALLAGDGDHPSAAGHALIARVLARAATVTALATRR